MKNDFVRFCISNLVTATFLVTLLITGLQEGEGLGQELNGSSGRAFQSSLQRQFQQADQNQTAIPGLGDLNSLTSNGLNSAGRNPFSGLLKNSKLPSLDGIRPKTNAEALDRSSSFSELFSKRDSNRQNFFQKMNSKSKDFIEKTKGWAKGRGTGAREKSNETWNNVIRDFNANKLKQKEQATIPVQPNFRSAEAIGEPKFRF